ncbi:MAG TPA: GNAT family N-acetyltransferase [Intrasporangium sp.]|uniref:GNAT family N-acetyltransferase n=1 Tax=Intrasporangium sp. TaxID=1925024 RepID=UPI002D798628|nr:GNAT family N-acetyltransferase [Intrasporangium sp.]HET7398423.1 GNAT family N-acetyltransferase [Intrasporangium sp.]
MGRPAIAVTRVEQPHHSAFIELWIAHRIEGGTTPEAAQRLALDGTLRAALGRSDICAFLASVDGVPAGYVVLADSTRSLLVDSPCVSIDMLFVLPDHRRTGVSRALLAASARYADRLGAEHIASAVPAADRDANRFFARLGFAPETIRRITTVTTLQRRLSGQRPQRYSLDHVLQRRREVRARGTRPQPPRIAG